MPPPYTGACVCKQVRFSLVEEPLTVYACHCSDCQAQSGSAFGLRMMARGAAVEILEGEPVSFAVELGDGRSRRGQVCPRCHTMLWGEPKLAPALVSMHPGNLDDTTWIDPIAHIWTASAQRWVSIPDGPFNHIGQPEDYLPMIQAYRARAAQN